MTTKRTKLISISLLIMLSVSMLGGIVSEDVCAAEVAKGYPHLEAEYSVNPESGSSIDEPVVVTLKIKGIGGKVEDLPPDVFWETAENSIYFEKEIILWR